MMGLFATFCWIGVIMNLNFNPLYGQVNYVPFMFCYICVCPSATLVLSKFYCLLIFIEY